MMWAHGWLNRQALDVMSSRPLSTASRPADLPRLRRALDYVPEGDMLVVWKLDRLGRPLAGLLKPLRSWWSSGPCA